MRSERPYNAQLEWKSVAANKNYSWKAFLIFGAVFSVSWVMCLFTYFVLLDNFYPGANMGTGFAAIIVLLVSFFLHIMALIIFVLLDIKWTSVEFIVLIILVSVAIFAYSKTNFIHILRPKDVFMYYFPIIFSHLMSKVMIASIKIGKDLLSEQA